MKNNFVLARAVAVGAILFFLGGCVSKPGGGPASGTANSAVAPGSLSIAYINIDTLEAHYELLKKRNEDFKNRQTQMEQELEQSYQQMQSKGDALQKKAQSGNMSQTEIEAAQKQLMLMQQSLESRKQSLTDQLLKEREDFQKDIKKKLDSFLETYNKDKHYDYILSYSDAGGSAIMYANKRFDITKDVIDGMNALSKNEVEDKKK